MQQPWRLIAPAVRPGHLRSSLRRRRRCPPRCPTRRRPVNQRARWRRTRATSEGRWTVPGTPSPRASRTTRSPPVSRSRRSRHGTTRRGCPLSSRSARTPPSSFPRPAGSSSPPPPKPWVWQSPMTSRRRPRPSSRACRTRWPPRHRRRTAGGRLLPVPCAPPMLTPVRQRFRPRPRHGWRLQRRPRLRLSWRGRRMPPSPTPLLKLPVQKARRSRKCRLTTRSMPPTTCDLTRRACHGARRICMFWNSSSCKSK
mmetsp:Transcript_50873/g.162815  ORF Transcript_50873/g.162815 Transcript_50873/m.162815 type:complete len:255 (-) Transcript_50873:592-1356(-)